MNKTTSSVAALACCLGLSPNPGTAQTLGGMDVVAVDVLPGWREPDGTHMAGIRIRLAPGWKTYWRVPGDGGIPPVFDLRGSRNLARFTPHMPRPTVYDEDGLRALGYKSEVVFALELEAAAPNAPIALEGALHIGVCEEICMPAEIRLKAVLTAPGQSSALIAQTLQAQPVVVAGQITCTFAHSPDGMTLNAAAPVPGATGEVAVIELGDPALWVSHAETQRMGGTLSAAVDIVAPTSAPVMIDRSEVRMTVLSADAAYELRGCAP